MAHQYVLNLPSSDAAIGHILLQYLLTEGHLVEELLTYDYDDAKKPVALKYTHTCTTFHLDAILQYLTSETVDQIPENAALFYDLFMRSSGIPKAFWNTRKRKSQFAYLNSNDHSLGNSMLRCLMNSDLGGRLSRENMIDDIQDGLCILFPADVKGGRLRDYISYLIGRKNNIKPVFMVYFFNLFVSGVNCYPLIPTRILKQFVCEEDLPERKTLIKSFPLPPEMEQVVSKLKDKLKIKRSSLYAKGRKLAFELSQFLGCAIKVEPETHRIVYQNHDDDQCLGSTMESMLRFLVGAHSPRRLILFDALTFYHEMIVVNDIDEVLFGKGTLSYLRSLDDEPITSDRPQIAADQGLKPVKCPQCTYIFGPKGAVVNLTEVATLPLRKISTPSVSAKLAIYEFDGPPPKLLRSSKIAPHIGQYSEMTVDQLLATTADDYEEAMVNARACETNRSENLPELGMSTSGTLVEFEGVAGKN